MGWASDYITRLEQGETVQFRPRGHSMKGKIEWNFAEDHEEEKKIEALIRDAIQKVFRQAFPRGAFEPFLKSFSNGDGWEASEMTPGRQYQAAMDRYPSIKESVFQVIDEPTPAAAASAAEFILEGLSILGRITKEVRQHSITYGSKA